MVLLDKQNVDGVDYGFHGTVPMGTCATPAGSEVKVCSFADSFPISAGCSIAVTFTYANTYGNGSSTYPKLSINGTAYPIKTNVGSYAYNGCWVNGQIVTFMFDGTAFVLASGVTVDSYEQTRYNPTINTTYVKDMSVADGVSVYKTRNGFKVLTGFFETKIDLTGSVADLFIFPEACRQTRPAQLWVNMVSVVTGKGYPLLMSGTQLGTWGSFFPIANEVMFIPPVTYL